MTLRRPLTALVLATALAGCGTAPTAARPATAPAPVVAAKAATEVPLATHRLTPTVTATTREVIRSVAPVKAEVPTASTLFDQDYNPAARYTAPTDEATTAAAVEADSEEGLVQAQGGASMNPGATSFGLIGAAIGGLLVGGSLAGYAVYTGMVGSKDLIYPTDKETMVQTPDHYGFAYERVSFTGHDGTALKGWYVPAAHPTTKALLLLHGHTSNKDRYFMKVGSWVHADYNVFVYDSRFHGESAGTITTLGWHERRDASKALDELQSRGNTSIGVMGESMGAAVAIGVAADEPSLKAIWADCAFDSLHDAVAPRAVLRKYPLPNYVAWSVVKTASLRAGHNLASADPIRSIKSLSPRPVYLVHGEADISTTPMNSDKLFAEAQQPKTLWTVPGATHAQSWSQAPVEYQQRLSTFFHAAL